MELLGTRKTDKVQNKWRREIRVISSDQTRESIVVSPTHRC